jgi:hypothetical protein
VWGRLRGSWRTPGLRGEGGIQLHFIEHNMSILVKTVKLATVGDELLYQYM